MDFVAMFLDNLFCGADYTIAFGWYHDRSVVNSICGNRYKAYLDNEVGSSQSRLQIGTEPKHTQRIASYQHECTYPSGLCESRHVLAKQQAMPCSVCLQRRV